MTRRALRHWPLAFVATLSTVLNSWALGSVGWGNQYYAAAVRSMSESWHAFLFGSFDSEGFVTVDKPPMSLWVQTVFVKVFGYHQMSLLVPQVLAGVGAVIIVYLTVVRRWGRIAATVGSLALAIAPMNVIVNHSNNTDAILTLAMTASVAAGIKAAETGRARWLITVAAFFGAAFTTKMLAAVPVLPAILLAFAFVAPVVWRRRAPLLAAGAAVAIVSVLAWFAFVDLTPTSARPYVGSSPTNSAFQLAFDRNGLGQVEGDTGVGPDGRGSVPSQPNQPNQPEQQPDRPQQPGQQPPRGPQPQQPQQPRQPQQPNGAPPQVGPAPAQNGPAGGQVGFEGGEPGLLRLFNSDLGTQIGWLVLPGILGALAAAVALGLTRTLRTPSVVAPAVWFALGGAAYSITKGIVHPYYVASITPPLAMLLGAGTGALRTRVDRRAWWVAAGLGVAACGVVQWMISDRAGYDLTTTLALCTIVAGIAITLLAIARIPRPRTWMAAATLLVLVTPAVWTVASLKAGFNANIPYANPVTAAGFVARPIGSPIGDTDELVDYLEANRGDATWLVAVPSAQLGSSIIIDTGEPVMALGGFSGGDPILDVREFDGLVRDGDVRFVLLGTTGQGPGRGPAQGANGPIATHVRQACTSVAVAGVQLYDCAKMTA